MTCEKLRGLWMVYTVLWWNAFALTIKHQISARKIAAIYLGSFMSKTCKIHRELIAT